MVKANSKNSKNSVTVKTQSSPTYIEATSSNNGVNIDVDSKLSNETIKATNKNQITTVDVKTNDEQPIIVENYSRIFEDYYNKTKEYIDVVQKNIDTNSRTFLKQMKTYHDLCSNYAYSCEQERKEFMEMYRYESNAAMTSINEKVNRIMSDIDNKITNAQNRLTESYLSNSSKLNKETQSYISEITTLSENKIDNLNKLYSNFTDLNENVKNNLNYATSKMSTCYNLLDEMEDVYSDCNVLYSNMHSLSDDIEAFAKTVRKDCASYTSQSEEYARQCKNYLGTIQTQDENSERFAKSAADSMQKAYEYQNNARISSQSVSDNLEIVRNLTNTNKTYNDNIEEQVNTVKQGIEDVAEVKSNINSVLETADNLEEALDNAKMYEENAKTYMEEAKECVEGVNRAVQADWAETDTNATSYIRNKPNKLSSDWGQIEGDITAQTDLQERLVGLQEGVDSKQDCLYVKEKSEFNYRDFDCEQPLYSLNGKNIIIGETLYDSGNRVSTILVSDNFELWERIFLPFDTDITDIVFNNGIYIILDGAYKLWLSYDLINWTIIEEDIINISSRKILTIENKFVLLNTDNSYVLTITYSVDGINWQQINVVPTWISGYSKLNEKTLILYQSDYSDETKNYITNVFKIDFDTLNCENIGVTNQEHSFNNCFFCNHNNTIYYWYKSDICKSLDGINFEKINTYSAYDITKFYVTNNIFYINAYSGSGIHSINYSNDITKSFNCCHLKNSDNSTSYTNCERNIGNVIYNNGIYLSFLRDEKLIPYLIYSDNGNVFYYDTEYIIKNKEVITDKVKSNDYRLITSNAVANELDKFATTSELKEVESIAKGRASGYVFDTTDDMNIWLETNSSVLKQGDNLYIIAKDVPDYWWDGSSVQELETQKVDLTEYYNIEEVDNLILQNNKDFLVTATYTSGAGYSVDKTLEEIKNAIAEGKDVRLLYDNSYYELSENNLNAVRFIKVEKESPGTINKSITVKLIIVYNTSVSGYSTVIPQLSAGTNISISNGKISATIPKYTAGENITISDDNVISVPTASTSVAGVAKANAAYGVYNNAGNLTISKATDAQVEAKTSQYRPLVPYNLDLAVKTGVTTNTIELTDEEKNKAKEWLGVSTAQQGDIVYSYADYEQVLNKSIKKVINNYILDTEGNLYQIDMETKFLSLYETRIADIVEYQNKVYYLEKAIYSGGLYEADTREFLKRTIKAVKTSATTMWILDFTGNLYGKGDNLFNQQGMTNEEIENLRSNNDWVNLYEVTDFVLRAENVEDFGCTEFATYYKSNGDYYIAGLSNTSATVTKKSSTSYDFVQETEGGFTYLGEGVKGVSLGSLLDYSYDYGFSYSSDKLHEIIKTLREYLITNFDLQVVPSLEYYNYLLTLEIITHLETGFTRKIVTYQIGSLDADIVGNYIFIPFLNQSFNYPGVITNPITTTSTTTTVGYTDIQTCGATTWYINNSGVLYGLGLADYGQQGSGAVTKVTSFTARESDEPVIKVFCNWGNTYYLTSNGNLYGTGYNRYNQLTKHRYYTTNLEYGISIKKFIKIDSDVKDFFVNEKFLIYWTNDNKLFISENKSVDYTDDFETTCDYYTIPFIVPETSSDLICDGRIIEGDCSPCSKTMTLYRLHNLSAGHYHQDLWTSDPYICSKKVGDSSKLYRHICLGGGQTKGTGFCNIKEGITISRGTVVSDSGFYDGFYEVSLDQTVEVDKSSIWYDKWQNNESYNQPCYADGMLHAERPVDYVSVGGVNNIYGNANTKISDNRWHIGVSSEPVSLKIGEQTTGAWVQTSLVHSSTISSVYNENLFNMELDFLVGSAISGTPAIIYSYRTLIIRPINTNGDINFYMAGYNSSGLKWRHNNVSTGMSVKTNTKYHFKFYTSDNKTDNPDLANNYQYTMELTAYDKYGNLTDDIQTFTFNSNYLPCCYYSNSVTNSLANLFDAEIVSTGIHLDLDSVKISYGQYVDNWTCYQPSFETNVNSMTILPDLSDDSKSARIKS